MEHTTWLLFGFFAGIGVFGLISTVVASVINTQIAANSSVEVSSYSEEPDRAVTAASLLRDHLQPLRFEDVTITERQFPFRMRADLQLALNEMFDQTVKVINFVGVRKEYCHSLGFHDCMIDHHGQIALPVPSEFEELDIGDAETLRVLKNGLWFLERGGVHFAVLLSPSISCGVCTMLQIQICSPKTPEGEAIVKEFFETLESSVAQSKTYRGKILSIERSEGSYSGASAGIVVHKLRLVEREQVILPEATLDLLERNVINFIKNRPQLNRLGLTTKKGILFYGPPGTGKTHTIHYLARGLAGHTTLLISAEDVAMLGEYMTLARLLQPSIVVMEDVDLIARDRTQMNSACEEILLNKLLNEMDGLKESADILFILTTNRPESLEAALASRPGRIDQAIEFPVPDDIGRRKLVVLYAPKSHLESALIDDIVRRTEGVSAAFIKEFMRRATQFAIERGSEESIEQADVDNAIDEMLFKGGSFNLSILGGKTATCEAC